MASEKNKLYYGDNYEILTIQQVLDGKQPQYPLHRRDATFRKAPAAALPQPKI